MVDKFHQHLTGRAKHLAAWAKVESKFMDYAGKHPEKFADATCTVTAESPEMSRVTVVDADGQPLFSALFQTDP